MKYGAFMAQLAKGNLPHAFLLAGEEAYYIEKAQERILAKLLPGGNGADAVQAIRGDISVDELIGLAESAPFFAEKNVIIVREAPWFRAERAKKEPEAGKAAQKKAKSGAEKKQERLLALLGNMPPYSYLIFRSSAKADKRKKICKALEKAGLLLEADAVRPWEINEWLQGKLQEMNKDFDHEAMTYFMGAVSVMQQISLTYLDRELSKLTLYTEERRITKRDLLQVFASLPEVSGFAMLDAVSAHDVRRALQLFVHQVQDGTYPPLLIALLVRHVRQLWQAKVLMAKGLRGRSLAQPMGLNPFIAEKVGRAAATFSEGQLRQAIWELADADYLLKTGQAGTELLEHAIILLCERPEAYSAAPSR